MCVVFGLAETSGCDYAAAVRRLFTHDSLLSAVYHRTGVLSVHGQSCGKTDAKQAIFPVNGIHLAFFHRDFYEILQNA